MFNYMMYFELIFCKSKTGWGFTTVTCGWPLVPGLFVNKLLPSAAGLVLYLVKNQLDVLCGLTVCSPLCSADPCVHPVSEHHLTPFTAATPQATPSMEQLLPLSYSLSGVF